MHHGVKHVLQGKVDQMHARQICLRRMEESHVFLWIFCYAGKKLEPLTPDERALPPDHKRLICLMLFDLQTGSMAALPVQKKARARFLCAEVCRFLSFLGHNEVEVRTDNEPVLLPLQKALQRARNKMGSQTHITTTKPLDHGSKSWVESCVHRVRQMALVLVREMELNLK